MTLSRHDFDPWMCAFALDDTVVEPQLRIETDEPNPQARPVKLIELPRRAKLRRERDDPSLNTSNTETAVSKVTRTLSDFSDMELPKRVKLRKDDELPSVRKSYRETTLPILV